MKQIGIRSKLKLSLFLAIITGLLTVYVTGWQSVFAGTLTQTSVVETNMVASGAGSVFIEFKTAGDASGTSASVNFSGITGVTLATGANTTVNGSSLNGCGTAGTGIFPGATAINGSSPSTSAGTLTFTSGTSFAASTLYCTVITATGSFITNGAAGTYPVVLTMGGDTQTDGVDVISSDTYTISGTVPSSFTMSLGSGSDTFTGNLSSTTYTTTSGETVTINTNSGSGWMLWAADANAGLLSSSKSQAVASVAVGALDDLSTGTYEGHNAFAIGVTSITAGSAATNYNDSTGHSGGGITATTTGFQQIASDSSSYSSADNVVVKLIADIAATDPASNDYNDTVTLVGAGSF